MKHRLSFVACIIIFLSSCEFTTDITDWKKTPLKWDKLPDEVKKAMIEATGPEPIETGSTQIIECVRPKVISLEKEINIKKEWVSSGGGGSGYHRLIINNKKYDLKSPWRGNEENAPYILFDHKLYYRITLNICKDSELSSADFGYFDFNNEY